MPTKQPPQQKPANQPLALDKRLQTLFADMPLTEQKIATLLLNSPGLLVSHTATELATLAKTSKATVSRLIQRLGYDSFTQARQEARQAQDWGSPLYLAQDEAEDEPTALKAKLAKQFNANAANFDKTWRAQDDQTLLRSVAHIANAKRIVVLGYRNSAYLAMYLVAQLELLRKNVTLVTDTSDHLASALYELDSSDAVVVIGLRRRVPVLQRALSHLRQSKIPVVLITDPSGLAIAHPSDHVLTCHCHSATLFDNYAATMGLLNFLLGQVATKLGQSSRARLRDIENLHHNLDDLI